MYSQLFNLLCDKADDFYGGRLPVHVRCFLDEFANIGQIPELRQADCHHPEAGEISASIILQSQSQLKTIYKDAADTIVGNCDSTLFLGGKEKSTLKEISELLGKETIDSFNQSENRGSPGFPRPHLSEIGKGADDTRRIGSDGRRQVYLHAAGRAPVPLGQVRPDKASPTTNTPPTPTRKYLFDMERYMKRKPAIVKPDEPFEMYELTATDLQ